MKRDVLLAVSFVKALDSYLQSKQPATITAETHHRSGRGVGYTKPAFAYLFQLEAG